KMPAEDQRASQGPERAQLVRRKLRKFLSDEEAAEHAKLHTELTKLKKSPEPARELALSVNHCPRTPPPTHVMIRGNARVPGAQVEPAFPTALNHPAPVIPSPPPGSKSSGRRTILANWIASPDNPLTARVIVNRLWQHHSGRALR